MATATTRIDLQFRDDIAELTLLPPEGKPPTLDWETLAELESHLSSIASRRADLRAVELRSASSKYFCVGANISVLETIDSESIVPWVHLGHRVFNQLEDLPLPTIACVRGYALGGGLELAMACDLIYASESAQLGQTEAKLGFFPGWGGSRRLAQRVGPSAAKRLFFTGRLLPAQAALDLSLVDFTGSPDALEEEVQATLADIRKASPQAIAAFKQIQRDETRAARDRNATQEASFSRLCLENSDTKARLEAFLRK